MIKINYLSTLFVGIDVSSKSNVVHSMDFGENMVLSSSFSNNQPSADKLDGMIHDCMVRTLIWVSLLLLWNRLPFTTYISPITFLPVRPSCLISPTFTALPLRQRLIIGSLTWQWIKQIPLMHTSL